MSVFEHEKLPVYHVALGVAKDAEALAKSLPTFRRDLQDQLRRASVSIVLNIAEGASEFSPAEKPRIYRIARRSTSETRAAVDAIGAVVAPTPALLARLASDLIQIEASLDKLIFAQQRR